VNAGEYYRPTNIILATASMTVETSPVNEAAVTDGAKYFNFYSFGPPKKSTL